MLGTMQIGILHTRHSSIWIQAASSLNWLYIALIGTNYVSFILNNCKNISLKYTYTCYKKQSTFNNNVNKAAIS